MVPPYRACGAISLGDNVTEEERKEKKRDSVRKWRLKYPERKRESKRKYRAANPEKKRAADRKWDNANREKVREHGRNNARKSRAENPEKQRESNRKWRSNNLEKARENTTKWRAENPEKHRESSRKWNAEHRERVRENQSRRRALKQGASISDVDLEFIWNRANGICYLCGKAIDRADCHFDHVIPLSKGGSHSTDNLRPTHSKCNVKKSNKIIKWIQGKLV